jgi:hypothetical protein
MLSRIKYIIYIIPENKQPNNYVENHCYLDNVAKPKQYNGLWLTKISISVYSVFRKCLVEVAFGLNASYY